MQLIYLNTHYKNERAEMINDIFKLVDFKEISIHIEKVNTDNEESVTVKQIKRMVRKGKLKTLVVYRLDHLFKNRKPLREFLLMCKRENVSVRSYFDYWLYDLDKLNGVSFDSVLKKQLMCQDYLQGEIPKNPRTRTGISIIGYTKKCEQTNLQVL